MEYYVIKSMSNIYRETLWLPKSRLQKRMLKKFLTFHMIFKIFFHNYSLGIINAHRSLAKRLRGRERGLGESSGFSHPLGRGMGGDW